MTNITHVSMIGARLVPPEAPALRMPAFVVTALSPIAALLAIIERRMAARRLRERLAEMDNALLRDIGIAEDEIHLIRAQEHFTPRAWLASAAGMPQRPGL